MWDEIRRAQFEDAIWNRDTDESFDSEGLELFASVGLLKQSGVVEPGDGAGGDGGAERVVVGKGEVAGGIEGVGGGRGEKRMRLEMGVSPS